MICNKCNHKLPEDSEFCQFCGSKIEKTSAVPAETAAEKAQRVNASTVNSAAPVVANTAHTSSALNHSQQNATGSTKIIKVAVKQHHKDASPASNEPSTLTVGAAKKSGKKWHVLCYGILAVLLVGVSLFAIFQHLNAIKIQDQMVRLETQINDKNQIIEQQETENEQLEKKIDSQKNTIKRLQNLLKPYVQQTVLICDPSSKVYHNSRCSEAIVAQKYHPETCYTLDLNVALDLGFYVCPKCLG